MDRHDAVHAADFVQAHTVAPTTATAFPEGPESEQFQKRGIHYVPSEQPKSEIYGAFLPLLNSGRVELLDVQRIAAQLLGLERRTARGGRDSIDHAPGGHDDVASGVPEPAAAMMSVMVRVPLGTFSHIAQVTSCPLQGRVGRSTKS